MEKSQENRFRYNDAGERMTRLNKFYIVASSIMWVFFIIYIWLKLNASAMEAASVFANTLLILVFIATNVATYIKKKTSPKLYLFVLVQAGFEMLLLGIQTDAEFIFYAVFIVLALQIPYYNPKVIKRAAFLYGIIYLIVTAARIVQNPMATTVDTVLKLLSVFLFLYVISKIGSLVKTFSDDALGAVEEQRLKQQEMFDGIIQISKTVSDKTEESSSLIDSLVTATESVATNMQEISSATNTTSESIDETDSMTHNIQKAITETGDRSKKMVSIAMESNNNIQNNISSMNELLEQSAVMTETNQKVTESMTRFQEKTREVEEIAGMILTISSRTNLLALNASIESARAGEAGKGFAVVADQIRQLAEQTKTSTEAITKIINELNENSNDVVHSIETSVTATDYQNRKIKETAEAFEALNSNMTALIADINEIDQQIIGLSEANNKIVENITQLSAATQQVSASAENVREMSENNLASAEQVKEAIGTIQDTSEGLKQYL